MKISARVENRLNQHESFVQTNESAKTIHIAPQSSGFGASINGGELLLLSLATCFCNDIYREAAKRNMKILSVEVEVTGDFGAEGEPGSNFQYKTNITSNSPASEIEDLVNYTDKVAEIHNTLRQGLNITLVK